MYTANNYFKKTNKFMKVPLHKSFLFFLAFIIVGCNVTPNLPLLVINDTNAEIALEASISLESLNEYSSDSIWAQFFNQRGGEQLWKVLQKRESVLSFSFQEFAKDLKGMSSQEVNELTAGIIYYLAWRQVEVGDLSLSYNRNLTAIPSEIGNLTILTTIDLSNNQLQVLPPEIGNLTSLRHLNLSSNQFQVIPSELDKLINLTCLNLSKNRFTNLPAEIGKLTKLRTLYLSNNCLTSLSAEVGKLTRLTKFYLSNNCLTSLPAEVGKLIRLIEFYLSNNCLTSLPAEVGKLANLKYLKLSNNKLTIIPNELGKLVNLKYLELSNNKLTIIPSELSKLNKLKNLGLYKNHLVKLPASIKYKFYNSSCRLLLKDNPLLEVSCAHLNKLDINEVKMAAYQSFPYTLFILCLRYIENNRKLFDLKELESKLPEDLCRSNREKLLQQASYWDVGKNIIFFRDIEETLVPFYLDFSLTTPKSVENMLVELQREQLYRLLEI
jgi:Leucine-rich repeat (LRR) protein